MCNIYNEDCIVGAKKIKDGSIDLIICDPPFGINESKFDKHYFRDKSKEIDGYQEAPKDISYEEWTCLWISECKRILKDNGSMYIVIGHSNLYAVLKAINSLGMNIINHLIWKFNFGVNTTKKFITSHYHILYVSRTKSSNLTFNTHCRYGADEKDGNGRSLLYRDLEDVFVINKEYQPGVRKNKNKLPIELLIKLIKYSTNRGDIVCDFFLGNFTTAYAAKKLDRRIIGFEINKNAYEEHIDKILNVEADEDLIAEANPGLPKNQGRPLSMEKKREMYMYFKKQREKNRTKKSIIEDMIEKYGRGRWSIERIIKYHE